MESSESNSPVPDRVNTSAIENALALEDYETVISEVRVAIAANPGAALADPVINDWLGKRFRNIFIDEAAAAAVAALLCAPARSAASASIASREAKCA